MLGYGDAPMPQRQNANRSMTGDAERSAEAIRAALNRKALASARHRVAAARLLGLGEREVLAIQYLAATGRLTPAQLGERLQLTSGGTTALVRRLERAGQVAREPHEQDRRSIVLRLTGDAARAATELFAPLVGDLDRLALDLSAEQRGLIGRFIEGAADAAERRADELVRRAGSPPPEAVGVPAPGLWA
jgi:DNA-binding MarR family transcriptional regulator